MPRDFIVWSNSSLISIAAMKALPPLFTANNCSTPNKVWPD